MQERRWIGGNRRQQDARPRRCQSTEPPYAEPLVRWCERSENESRKKTISFSSYSIYIVCAVLSSQNFNEFLYGSVDAISVLATGCSEVGLTTATTLDELGSLANVLADINATGYYAV